MPSRLTEAHIRGEKRIRDVTARAVESAWVSLPGYDRGNVPQFLERALPAVRAGVRASVNLTAAYIARAREEQPAGFDADQVIAGLRGGVSLEEVYRRPFVTVWTALEAGTLWADAVELGRERAVTAAVTDPQLAMRATASALDNGFGYRRVADGDACEFCQAVNGAYVKGSGYVMALHPHCVIGSTRIASDLSPSDLSAEAASLRGAQAVTRRWYSGEVVVLQTASGHVLTVTPNHPILTGRGWVAAGLLQEGDSVVSALGRDGEHGGVPDEEDMPPRIEDCFRPDGVSAFITMPLAAEQFHGDGERRNVDVVALDSRLDAGDLAAIFQPSQQSALPSRFGLSVPFAGGRGSAHRGFLRGLSALRGVCARHAGMAFLDAFAGRGNAVLLAGASLGNPGFGQQPIYDPSGHPVPGRDFQDGIARDVFLDRSGNLDGSGADRDLSGSQGAKQSLGVDADHARRTVGSLAGQVQLDRLVNVSRRDFSSHVFNLSTENGWFAANGIVTHNCGCSLEPLTEPHRGAVNLPDGTEIRPYAYGPLNDKVAVHQHGELGAVLMDPSHHFKSLSEIS